MTPDLETHKVIIARLKASQSVEDVSSAACWGFQHLFDHIVEQNRKIEALQEQLAALRQSSSSGDGSISF